MVAMVLLITRSLRPAFMLFTNVGEDWTLLSFGLFGVMPPLVAISFDEVDGDGDLDVFAGLLKRVTRVWLNDGTGRFAERR